MHAAPVLCAAASSLTQCTAASDLPNLPVSWWPIPEAITMLFSLMSAIMKHSQKNDSRTAGGSDVGVKEGSVQYLCTLPLVHASSY